MAETDNYRFKKHHFGYPVRDDELGDALDLIDAAIKAREDETDATDTLADAKIIVGNSDGIAADVAMSGDVTISNTGATTIGADKVSNTKLANIARGSVKVGGASNAPTDLAAKATGNILVGDGTDIKSVAMSGDVTIIADGTITIGADKVTNTMLENMTRGTMKVGGASGAPTDLDAKTDAQILVGDGTDIASVAMSGDVTIINTGETAIGADKVTKTMLNGDVVGSGISQAVGGELDRDAITLKGIVTTEVSFAADRHTATKIYFPFAAIITKIRSIVMQQLAGTDVGTITGANSVGDSADGVVTIAAAAVLDEEDVTVPSTNNTVAADSYYKLTSAKATPGGKSLVTLEYTQSV